MANYIYATELDAYNVGNPAISKYATAPINTKLCTKNRANALGCCVNRSYLMIDQDIDSYNSNLTGITYTGTQLVCKVDLSVDPGIITSGTKTMGVQVGNLQTTGDSSIIFNNATYEPSECYVILSTSTVSSGANLPWSNLSSSDNIMINSNDWSLVKLDNNYCIIMQEGGVPSNNTLTKSLKVLTGSTVSSNIPCTIKFDTSSSVKAAFDNGSTGMYMHVLLKGLVRQGGTHYLINIPVSTASSTINSIGISYPNSGIVNVSANNNKFVWKAISQGQ